MSDIISDDPPSGKLSSISIKNFRGFEQLDLVFRAPKGTANTVVVLAGPNGCGKTSVLEACLLVSGQQRFVLGPTGQNAIRSGEEFFSIDAEFVDEDGVITSQHYSEKGGSVRRAPCIYLHSGRTDALVGPLGITAGRQRLKSFGAARFRRVGEPSRPSEGSRAKSPRLRVIKQHMINAWAHSLAGDAAPHFLPANPYKNTVAWIEKMWNMFYPNSGQKFAVDSAGADPDDGFDVYLITPNRPRITVDCLSSGQLEIFTLAGAVGLLKVAPSIVFIDEVELHLDPQWHRLILHALRMMLPSTQLIVTTHSPEVYGSVRSFERYFLVPSDDPRAVTWMRSTHESTP
jgi:energy-coupling factor transporter ATP-binding protein EcfA2